ncbi:MAG: hypothetical protein EBY22_07055 [Gammaproteobacteria bacterium]|nr:hypothetical protein [Gammaproteobacteria bacterium]
MNKNQLITISGRAGLAWRLPLPVWPALKIGSRSLRYTYTFSNQSSDSIQITGIRLEPGNDGHVDDRVGLVGGTAHAGLMLAPRASCTIDVQITPSKLGNGHQVLTVQHTGGASPMWTEIAFSVVAQGDTRPKTTYLSDDTATLDRQRRLIEQEGHRHYARVNAREHTPEQSTQQNLAQEGGMQNNILQNPWLNSQRFDGIDPNLNPEPPLNTEARREFDNERREQEMEKQLRLGNMPRVSPAPKPQGF